MGSQGKGTKALQGKGSANKARPRGKQGKGDLLDLPREAKDRCKLQLAQVRVEIATNWSRNDVVAVAISTFEYGVMISVVYYLFPQIFPISTKIAQI